MKIKLLTVAVISASVGFGATTASSAALEEILVTAQKRSQSLQDVPFSVTAMSGKSLQDAGVVDLMDLQNISPSLMTPSTGSPGEGASFRLRGFGSPPFQLGIEPAVATFVDNVYRSRSGVAVNDLIDLERIEVLKGPQGTLFGKNTTAGVIHILTKRPNLEETEGFVEIGYEKYDRVRVKGMLNTPVGDKSALRVTGMWGKGDGWLEHNGEPDDANDLDRFNVRAQWLFVPSDDLDINLNLQYGEIDEICCGPVLLEELDDLAIHDSFNAVNDSTEMLYSAEINWQLSDDVKLTSITAYQDFDLDTTVDGDFVELDFLAIVTEVGIESFTQELRLSGSTEAIEWTLGGFYSDDTIDRDRAFFWGPAIIFTPFPLVPGLGVLDEMTQDATSYSVFGQATFSFGEKLAVTAGLRYTDEEKDGEGVFTHAQFGPPGVVNPSFDASVDESEPSGMLSVQYDWSEDVMTYATYQHGYKAGGINLAREAAGIIGQPGEPTFDKEEADNYELGAKMELMDDRLRLNVAIFHTEFDDLQSSVLVGQSFILRNGEGAEIDGLEIEGAFAATDNLRFNFGLTLLDTEFNSGTDLGQGDIGGSDLPWAPETAGNIGWDYILPLNDSGLEVFWSGSALYKSSYFANSGSDPASKQDSFETFNTRLGLRNDSWSGVLWCRNCTDEQVKDVQFNNPLFGNPLVFPNRPIELGVTVTYDF